MVASRSAVSRDGRAATARLVLRDPPNQGEKSTRRRTLPVPGKKLLDPAMTNNLAQNLPSITGRSWSLIDQMPAAVWQPSFNAVWQNGVSTKALLEALGSDDADENKDGLLSATELARYVDRRVRNLTAGGQSPAFGNPLRRHAVRLAIAFPAALRFR